MKKQKTRFRIFKCYKSEHIIWYEVQIKTGWFTWEWLVDEAVSNAGSVQRSRLKFTTLQEAADKCKCLALEKTPIVRDLQLTTEY